MSKDAVWDYFKKIHSDASKAHCKNCCKLCIITSRFVLLSVALHHYTNLRLAISVYLSVSSEGVVKLSVWLRFQPKPQI